MKLIVGLGNPGKEYEKTRHNAGFITIDKIIDQLNIYDTYKKYFKAEYWTYRYQNEKIIFLKPQAYMNLSGEAVQRIMNFYKIHVDDIVIIYDDKDIEFGKIKLKLTGSSAGHNGIKDIISKLKTEKFNRIKFGIGTSSNVRIDIKDWVLSNFTRTELATVDAITNKISDCINRYIKGENFEKIASLYNIK